MATYVVWVIFAVVAVLLGLVGYHFSVRTVRWFTAIVAFALALAITAYGLMQSSPASSNLESSFARGADAVGDAFFHPLGLGNPVSGPGRAGWVVIVILLVLGYRELEAWALHWQAPELDTSKLGDGQPSIKPDGPAGKSADGLTDGQRHQLMAAEVGFRLAAMEVRAPAILPGGSRSAGLATIAETSGFSGGGLAGAIIRFFGLLWPNPRQVQVQVWMESADLARVTVELSDPRNGATLSTKTLAARSLDEVATRVAGYVARQIFSMDPATPNWCFGAPDGGDLAALLLSRQLRVRVETPDDVLRSRYAQIAQLKNVAMGRRCAGVVRYELAQLYSIQGEPAEQHLTALRLHAVNREQYPRFYRGRYRLGMSLEMVADPGLRFTEREAAQEDLAEILAILHRCRLTENQLRAEDEIRPVADGEGYSELTPAVRLELLKAAQQELRGARRQLTLGGVLWAAFARRHERAIWRVYLQGRQGRRARQSFHDGVCVAELLVAARRRATGQSLPTEQSPGRQAAGRRFRPLTARHLRLAIRVASAIAGADPLIDSVPDSPRHQNPRDPWPPPHPPGRPAPPDPRDRLRWWPWSRQSVSWQAAYNTACLYAALTAQRLATQRLATAEPLPAAERRAWEERVVISLERVVNNQYAEMERPYDTVSQDPDFAALRAASGQFPAFRKFLDEQRRIDYPEADVAQARLGLADLPHRGSAGPARERRPQRGHVGLVKAEGREDHVAPAVEPPSGVGEVPFLQTGVEPAGKRDHLVGGVLRKRRRGVDVVAGLGPAGQRAHLAADDVLQVQHRADVHRHRLRRPVEVRQLQHGALAVGRGDRPLGQPVAHALEDIGQFGRRALPLGREPRPVQRALHRAGRRQHAVRLVREQVDVYVGTFVYLSVNIGYVCSLSVSARLAHSRPLFRYVACCEGTG
ncbi:MAG TPA: hypothetical protein VMF87_35070 [Streptosporangiaceae bacterium]|nr:hypothetical protein [Streptosporangiaceae bacterium]